MGPAREAIGAELVAKVLGAYSGRPAAQASAARERYAILQRSLAKLSAAGARIVLGGDTGTAGRSHSASPNTASSS
jgi:hypothetical protein